MRLSKTTRRLGAGRICIAFLIAAPLLLTSCGKKGGGDDEDSAAKTPVVVSVTTTTVKRGDISRIQLINGPVAAVPNRDVKVSSLVAGRVAAVNVAEGDHVASGQIVAKVDDHTFRDQVSQAEAAVQQAQSSLENAKLNFTRNQDLFQRGIAARKEVEDARNEQNAAEAAVKTATAQLSTAQLQVSRTEIRAPIAGTVVKRSISAGEQVDGTAATPIVEVAELDEVELAANIPAASMAQLRQGEEVSLKTDALPGRNFTGHVIAISQAVDPASNAGLVRIRISNRDHALRLGMFLGAQIPIETHKNVLLVPSQSIYRDEEGKPRVFQVEGDTATAQDVKLGIETAATDEILDGVTAGETIILNNGYGIEDKAKVKVEPANAGSDSGGGKDDKSDADAAKSAKPNGDAKKAAPKGGAGAKKDDKTP